jgi:hypothetical protein
VDNHEDLDANWWWYPPSAAGIQANHCKNPQCQNFGIAPIQTRRKKTKGSSGSSSDYTVVASGKGHPVLRCNVCFEHLPMQSNLAIVEEMTRIAVYLDSGVNHHAPTTHVSSTACQWS